MRRAAARSGEWAQHFSNASYYIQYGPLQLLTGVGGAVERRSLTANKRELPVDVGGRGRATLTTHQLVAVQNCRRRRVAALTINHCTR